MMMPGKHSLYLRYPKHFEVPVFLISAAVCLGYGLYLPVIYLKQLVFWKQTFSVITGIENLFQEKYYFLAGIILLFSVIFPVTKLLILGYIWFYPLTDKGRLTVLEWTSRMGKWSMLDVFVVAITIIISRLSGLTKAEARPGLYVFAASVFLSMLTAMWIERLAKKAFKKSASTWSS